MSKVIADLSTSLSGFINGPDVRTGNGTASSGAVVVARRMFDARRRERGRAAVSEDVTRKAS